jgi:hypothetical protein
MKQSDSLFELIKTLSKSEKRYFQLYSSMQSGNKNYMKLYRELVSMASLRHQYDESRIKSIFKNEAFIRQLTFTKNYLMDALLKILSQYKGTSAIDAEISSVISKAAICYEKALYRSFSQLTTKASDLCRRHERYALYLQVLELEKVTIIKKIPHARNETRILEEENKTIEKIRNLSGYDAIISRLTILYREKGRARDGSVLDEINSIESMDSMRSEDKALSLTSLERFYFVRQLIADLKGDLEQMYVHALKRLDIISNSPEPFKDRSFNYMHDVIMYVLLLAPRLGKVINTKMYTDLLKEHTGNSESDRINLFLIMSTLKLLYYDVNSGVKVAVSEITAITEGLEKYKGKIDSNFEILIYNFLAKTCISGGDYVSANKFLNILLNHPEIGIRKDLEAYAKILNLLVHYELGNFDLLEHLIKSTYRFLMRRKGLYRFESIILKFLRKLSSVSDQAQLKEQLELLYHEISALRKDPYEMNAILYFDLPKWIEQKLRQL